MNTTITWRVLFFTEWTNTTKIKRPLIHRSGDIILASAARNTYYFSVACGTCELHLRQVCGISVTQLEPADPPSRCTDDRRGKKTKRLTLNSCSLHMTTGICRSSRGCFCFFIWFPSSSAKNQPCTLSSSDTHTHTHSSMMWTTQWA